MEYLSQNTRIQSDQLPVGLHLESSRLVFRRVTVEDVRERYLNWLQDPEVNEFLETRWAEQTLETINEFVQERLGDPLVYLLAIIKRIDGKHIGNIKLGPINPIHLSADISYFIGEKQEWHKGYASESVERISQFGLDDLGLRSIQAGVYGKNEQSAKVLENCGFQKAGRFRLKLRYKERWDDHLVYNLVNPNWPK